MVRRELTDRAYAIANALRRAASTFEEDSRNERLPERTRDQFARQAEEASTIAEALENADELVVFGDDAADILRNLG